ncbi:hypothetical protein I314_04659 [Cryptococcus bacillisporus CA1873]|uniref:Uncharacterized protein n=2 Tax=Cryptococcus gattii TaxID=552467 RepID=A0A0D0TIA9_CRYGA|nr:hypothetical protein I312_04298 [Cryptococcus bacillisporus CA1280]KIR59663.1 hypothetical protein I314_04659 [Cryptococcus bacillisporus CA1873]|eukprot:KIR59663.1 hypothetical protein I314_04659 [Cryptococcus gattii CA1873]
MRNGMHKLVSCNRALPMGVFKSINEFVGCLCRGETAAGGIGNKTISASAGVCLNCRTTPGPQGFHTNITEPQPYEYQY